MIPIEDPALSESVFLCYGLEDSVGRGTKSGIHLFVNERSLVALLAEKLLFCDKGLPFTPRYAYEPELWRASEVFGDNFVVTSWLLLAFGTSLC